MYYSTSKEMERLDELAVENGLEIRQMMELAGWHILSVFDELKIKTSSRVVIVCGVGNKGGDGLSAARHLVNHGYNVSVVLLSKKISLDSEHHLALLQIMEIKTIMFESDRAKELIADADIVIDALIGYHLNGAPHGTFKKAVELINSSKATTISYDLPTGVDATTAECFDPCIQADATLTLALPKKLFETKSGQDYSGKIFLADIGIPAKLYDQISPNSRPEFKNGIISL